MTLDIGRSFTYMFEDESWIMKIVIGGILAFIPVAQLMVLGYMVEVLRGAADAVDTPLPEWEDFGGKLVAGLVAVVILLVYAIPLLLVACCTLGLVTVVGDNETLTGMVSIISALCVSCVSFIWILVMVVAVPAAWIRYAVTGEFMSAFQFGELFSFISPNIANYIVAIILTGVAIFVASFGMIACCVGVFFTGFWASLVMGHLMGQVQRESLAVA